VEHPARLCGDPGGLYHVIVIHTAAGFKEAVNFNAGLNGNAIIPPMTSRPIIFRIHAIQRMFERRVSEEDVRQVLQHGEMIEDYSDEMPNPGGLMSGKRGVRSLHVVMSENTQDNELIVITAYEPDRSQWKSGSRARDRKK
jgi:hypothetical protein